MSYDGRGIANGRVKRREAMQGNGKARQRIGKQRHGNATLGRVQPVEKEREISTMKKCKICHVEAELVDGRCRSCRMAKEATDHHMTYGKYAAMVDPPKVYTPKEDTAKCQWCGAFFLITKRRTKFCSAECEGKANFKPVEVTLTAKPTKQPKPCAVCGRMFIPVRNDPRLKYCSPECCSVANNRAATERRRAKREQEQLS